MFNFKRQPKRMTEEEYLSEYRRLTRDLNNQFARDSPQEQVLNAMGVIEREMNGNGGANWVESDYVDFLDILREHLATENRFSSEQLAKIRWSIEEITACGRELDQHGESSRRATEAVDYVILRVVDWYHWHSCAH